MKQHLGVSKASLPPRFYQHPDSQRHSIFLPLVYLVHVAVTRLNETSKWEKLLIELQAAN